MVEMSAYVGPFERVKALFLFTFFVGDTPPSPKDKQGGVDTLLRQQALSFSRKSAKNDVGGGGLADGSELLCGWDIIVRQHSKTIP
jgi:hypothetical protein